MGFRINSNIGSMNANLHSNLNNMGINKSLGSFASGSAINHAAYDASGLGIAN
jgi:flagellin-like hook-associated protein FlgL